MWVEIEALEPIIGIPRTVIKGTGAGPYQFSRQVSLGKGARLTMQSYAARDLASINASPPFAIIRDGIRFRFKSKQALLDGLGGAAAEDW